MTKPANTPKRQPARRPRTITVTAHHMPNNWHIGMATGNLAILCGLWFGDYGQMMLAGVLILVGCLGWYAISRLMWQRHILRRAAGRQILIRKPKRWWRTWQ